MLIPTTTWIVVGRATQDAKAERTGMYLQRVMSEEQTSLLSYYLLLKRNELLGGSFR